MLPGLVLPLDSELLFKQRPHECGPDFAKSLCAHICSARGLWTYGDKVLRLFQDLSGQMVQTQEYLLCLGSGCRGLWVSFHWEEGLGSSGKSGCHVRTQSGRVPRGEVKQMVHQTGGHCLLEEEVESVPEEEGLTVMAASTLVTAHPHPTPPPPAQLQSLSCSLSISLSPCLLLRNKPCNLEVRSNDDFYFKELCERLQTSHPSLSGFVTGSSYQMAEIFSGEGGEAN